MILKQVLRYAHSRPPALTRSGRRSCQSHAPLLNGSTVRVRRTDNVSTRSCSVKLSAIDVVSAGDDHGCKREEGIHTEFGAQTRVV